MSAENKSIKAREDDLETIVAEGKRRGLNNIQMIRAMVILWTGMADSERKTDASRLEQAVLQALASDQQFAKAS
jgi:hypothetical protein